MRRTTGLVLLLLATLDSPARADDADDRVRLDRFLAEVAEHERWEQWDKACAVYATIESERLKVPDDFDFRYGAASFRGRKDDRGAQERLSAFVKRARRDSAEYVQAMQYLVDLERRFEIARQEAATEAARRAEEEAAAKRADEERARDRAVELQRRGEFLRLQAAQADGRVWGALCFAGSEIVAFGVGMAMMASGESDDILPTRRSRSRCRLCL